MASYGQYNRNQVASEDAADALEQSIFDSDHLYQKYRDELSPLLQEAELRLGEGGIKKFTKIENILATHVNRWYALNKNLCEMALGFRTHYNHINVKLDSLKVEIDERDKIIRTQRKDFETDKQQYENQLKVLESALADSIPRNKSSLLSKYEAELCSSDESYNYQLTQTKKDLKNQQQQYSKLKVENKRLGENIKILKSNSNDFQQTLMNLNNEIAKKEDEILKLRWLTQDLAAERNGLELKVQQHSKDPNFTSVTPQRQMEYGVDLSKYLDDDADDLSDDAAENGLLSLEMSDDADINPQVAAKLAEALEAVKKVTQFANDRDNDARQLESDKISHSDHSRPNVAKSTDYKHTPASKPSVNELYSNFEQMKRLQDSSPSEAHTLISQMGGFNSLTNYISTNDNHYTSMLRRVESHIGHGTNCIESIAKCITKVTDDEKHTSTLSKSHSTLTELRAHSDALISILNSVITELHSAGDYIHSDHKKVELLHHQMKELELTMPYIESEQLAILNTLPSFLKQELNKIERPNRIRTTQQAQAMDAQEEKQRQLNFDNALSRVEMLNISIKEKTDIIKNNLRNNLEASQADPKAFAQYLQQIDIACDQISEYTLSLDDEFHFAREYIHPSQAALISVVNQYNNLQIECEQLQKMVSIKQGEINAYEEMKNSRQRKQHTSLQTRDESFQFDDIEKDFMNFEKYAHAQNVQEKHDDGELVPTINNILSQFKYKASVVQAKIKNNYDLANDFNLLMELIDELNTHLTRAKQIMGPDSKYIDRLEKRYIQIMGLYQMKYAEVEHKSDLLYQSDQYINDLKEDVSDLDYRLGAVMSSAVSNVETRMSAFNDMGIKIQTFQKVLKLIDDTYTNIQQACQDIQESVEKDLYGIIGDTFNDKQHQDTVGMMGNVAHACDYILKAFDDIGQEMDGVAQFVHPDREMCEQLQLELIAMYETQEKQQQELGDEEEQKESEDIVTKLPTHPKIKVGDSADDIHIGSRRKSLLAFQQAFVLGKKRQSIKNMEMGLDKLKKEDLRRSKNSRRRRSSVSNLPPMGVLLPPVADMPLTRSDVGCHSLKDPMNEEDVTYLKSLAKDLKNINVSRLKETPANSPLCSPKDTANAPSPRSEDDDDGFALNIDDAVDDADIHVHGGGGISIQLNSGRDRKRDRERDNENNEKYISSLKKQIEDKQSLIGDLQTNLRELSSNRRRELLHFQQQLESMKQRCRDWYDQLMRRVSEMESAYREKINQELVVRERQLEEERRRIRQEERDRERERDSNPHEIDELSREIARLNEELEKFKGKYFDGEQSKIELADQLDEIKEEKFKMEEKLEELASEVEKLENIIRNNQNNKSTKEWNDLVQKLREEKEQQEAQYEEEFREFERMANEKVVQLEEYYVQQLQMKEVHNQQLQQQLHNTQQQMLLLNNTQQQYQNQNQNQNQKQNNIQTLHEEINKLKEKNIDISHKLTAENQKLSTELSKLQYQQSHDREQLLAYKRKNDANESKISAYNASFIELAEKLKQLNDDTKALRRENNKKERKCVRLEKSKKKIKAEIKNLNEKIDNIRIVTKDLVRIKQETKLQSEEWEKERIKYGNNLHEIKAQMMQQAKKKIESINKYNVEMNNLRTNIKTLQKRVVMGELENDKLRETDSQSVIGSAANWVPSVFWTTKK